LTVRATDLAKDDKPRHASPDDMRQNGSAAADDDSRVPAGDVDALQTERGDDVRTTPA